MEWGAEGELKMRGKMQDRTIVSVCRLYAKAESETTVKILFVKWSLRVLIRPTCFRVLLFTPIHVGLLCMHVFPLSLAALFVCCF